MQSIAFVNRTALLLCLLAAGPPRANGDIRVLGITSSADFSVGVLKPGGLASIFCQGIQNVPTLVVADQYPLPRTLAGVRVSFGAIDAPILAVANLGGGTYQQINVQIPWEVTSANTFDLSQNGASTHFAGSSDASWAVFFSDPSGYAIAQHAADYRPVTLTDPARPGEWVTAYATNLGPVQNQPPDGQPAAPDMLAPILPDTSGYLVYYGVAVGPNAGYQSSRIISNYIGMVPGSIIYQVNLLVPATQPAGDLVVQIIKVYDCGFFFVIGCGRSLTTVASSVPVKIPVR